MTVATLEHGLLGVMRGGHSGQPEGHNGHTGKIARMPELRKIVGQHITY